MGKYHHSERTNHHPVVSYKTLDERGAIISRFENAACFRDIIYSMYKLDAYFTVVVERNLNEMPYDILEINRWINDLNEMGFPCSVVSNDSNNSKEYNWAKSTVYEKYDLVLPLRNHGAAPINSGASCYNFIVNCKDYVNKSHFFSTLTLIRTLFEQSISIIPEIYFEAMDKDPNGNKFQALQNAHKHQYLGWGHVITYQDNGKNVTHELLKKRFEVKATINDNRPLKIHWSWNGDSSAIT